MICRLIAAVLLGLASCMATANAQSKTAKVPAGSIEIVAVKDGQFRYQIKNAADKILMIPPEETSWEKVADVLQVIQDLKLTISTTPIDDPASNEEFKDKEFRYSFRIWSPKGAIVAVPPGEMQWQTKTELFVAIQAVRAVLQTATPIDATGRIELKVEDKPGFCMGRPGLSTPGVPKKGSKK